MARIMEGSMVAAIMAVLTEAADMSVVDIIERA